MLSFSIKYILKMKMKNKKKNDSNETTIKQRKNARI